MEYGQRVISRCGGAGSGLVAHRAAWLCNCVYFDPVAAAVPPQVQGIEGMMEKIRATKKHMDNAEFVELMEASHAVRCVCLYSIKLRG